ncbi:MAG: GNAT family N-acetyltransferase [Pseudomonas sp.]|nr:MAG: GNAT family N-acetyltransferase [Pseudomonas sp.]
MSQYAVERWRDLKAEMLPLLTRHWREIALNHADVPLDIDHDQYDALDESGALHILTVRQEGKLIGYHVAIVSGHLHYKSTLHGITDVYWIAPERRHGVTGMRMFQAVERELKAIGVRKLFTATKLHLDQGPLFERLGYKPVERLYAKILKD